MDARPSRPIIRAPAKPFPSTGPRPAPDRAQAEDMPLDILYEDDDLLVLNKPPGLVVHPAAGHAEHTLVNALLHHCAGRLSGIGGVARPGIVHRLDKETSGCLVVAKNDAAHLKLSAQFAGREVVKIYQAIVCGRMPRAAGEIDAAIARHPAQRKRMAVAGAGGRQARTSYRVLEQWPAGRPGGDAPAHRAHPSNPRSPGASGLPGAGRFGLWPAAERAVSRRPPATSRPASCFTPPNWPWSIPAPKSA